jgi:hypothetical protein
LIFEVMTHISSDDLKVVIYYTEFKMVYAMRPEVKDLDIPKKSIKS